MGICFKCGQEIFGWHVCPEVMSGTGGHVVTTGGPWCPYCGARLEVR